METTAVFPPQYFRKMDPTDDERFYQFPRLVVHIDDGAIAALSGLLGQVLPQNGRYLDLMSSWRSHLPETLAPDEVVGLGMNSEEMARNPQLTSHLVHNLNKQQRLPFDDGAFEAAICTVSVQYLQKPLEVFAEVGRVLKPGAPFVVSFSNRCFPTKAVLVWQQTRDDQHVQLVGDYFRKTAVWEEPQLFAHTPRGSDPLFAVWATKRLNK